MRGTAGKKKSRAAVSQTRARGSIQEGTAEVDEDHSDLSNSDGNNRAFISDTF